MAANSSSRGIVSLGKRVVNEIRARDSTQLSALTLRGVCEKEIHVTPNPSKTCALLCLWDVFLRCIAI
ncbi:hypothetical protein GBA52_005816 [Prunus armeniaca]|nr:hypothetical protein GBA52_005816 [Prunus armeniaca]